MRLETDNVDLEGKKTVKLQLPKRQLLRLKSQKILTGDNLSDIATQALAEYFERRETDEEEMDEEEP